VQKEVAERLTAVPPHMSLLAVSAQYYGPVQRVATLKAGAFWPRPDVDSAVIRLDVSHLPAPGDQSHFFRVVRAGFSQKRKQLHNNLRQLGLEQAELDTIFQTTEVDGRRRAETLTLEEWRRLVERIREPVSLHNEQPDVRDYANN
jgi:16S rRNA (adenine1518-N6/adenine1519-N6)-dimethyltransferase